MAGELIGDTTGTPVTLAGPVDVSDRAGRALGIVSAAALPLPAGAATEASLAAVNGKLPSALVADRLKVDGSGVTQPVSIAAAVDVSDRAGRLVGVVDTELPAAAALADNTATPTVPGVGAFAMGWDGAAWDRILADTVRGQQIHHKASDLSVTVTGGANAIATLTLPAAGAGLFHYITSIHIRRVATAALAGGAILTVTTTNLPGNPSWRTGNQMSITVSTSDTPILVDQQYASPLKSSAANVATTIVAPAAGAAVSWHMVVHYYVGP